MMCGDFLVIYFIIEIIKQNDIPVIVCTTKSMIQRELKIYKNVMYERRIGMHILIYDIIPGTIFLYKNNNTHLGLNNYEKYILFSYILQSLKFRNMKKCIRRTKKGVSV